MEEVCESGGWL